MAAPLLLKDGVLDGISRFDAVRGDGVHGTPPEPPPPARPESLDTAKLGIWLLLGTISMLFIGFTSAYLVRRGSADWMTLRPPMIVWVNTAALALSSVTLEGARRHLRAARYSAVGTWISATGLLGLLFVIGQVGAWKALAAQGIFLATNPSSSFFYMLTGVHVAHVAAALLWYAVVFVRVLLRRYEPGTDALSLFATFWHFLAGVWAYLLFVFFVL
jgi:cytochrome c oxidase subunit III